VLVCKKAADQRRRGVEDLQRAADHQTAAHVRPAPRVHVGVFDLVFGILAALALALKPQLERLPFELDAILIFERERRIEGEEGKRTLEVRIRLQLFEVLFHADRHTCWPPLMWISAPFT
jgi:hypothetical protein